jgi:hypothetical protein
MVIVIGIFASNACDEALSNNLAVKILLPILILTVIMESSPVSLIE